MVSENLIGMMWDRFIESLAIDTDLWRQMPREVVEQVFAAMPPKSKLQGASTPLVAALDPNLTSRSLLNNFIYFVTNVSLFQAYLALI